MALNSSSASAVRSAEFPAWLSDPDHPRCKQEKVQLGNALADAMVALASTQARIRRPAKLKLPARSLMFAYPPVSSMMPEFHVVAFQADACVVGAPLRKPLMVITPTGGGASDQCNMPRLARSYRPPRAVTPRCPIDTSRRSLLRLGPSGSSTNGVL